MVFALQNASSGTQELKGLEVEELGTEAWTVRFDLEVHAIERNGQLDIVWIYNRDLFDRWRIEQMAGHYERLLTAVVEDLNKPVCHLEMLSPSEIQQLKICGVNRAGRWNGERQIHTSRLGHLWSKRWPVYGRRRWDWTELAWMTIFSILVDIRC